MSEMPSPSKPRAATTQLFETTADCLPLVSVTRALMVWVPAVSPVRVRVGPHGLQVVAASRRHSRVSEPAGSSPSAAVTATPALLVVYAGTARPAVGASWSSLDHTRSE